MNQPKKGFPPNREATGPALLRPGALRGPNVAQPMAAPAQQLRKPPAAPPVYRPQPAPHALQPKPSLAQSRPAAPPVYRPQHLPRVLQTKTPQGQPRPGQQASQPHARPAAPPAYRPTRAPGVLQPKSPHATPSIPGRDNLNAPRDWQLRGAAPARVVQQTPAHASRLPASTPGSPPERKPAAGFERPGLRGAPQTPARAGVVALKPFASQVAQRATAPGVQPSRPPLPQRFTSQVIQRAVKKVPYSSKYAAEARRMRETTKVGGCNIATAYFKILSTGKYKYYTYASHSRHSEKIIYDKLEEKHPGDYEVKWLYTELEPCGPEVHNCRARVENWFPGAPVYYSYIYPDADDVSSDEETVQDRKLDARKRRDLKWAKKREKAKRRRKRSINLIRRLNNQPSLDNLSESDFRGGIVAPYSPYRNDPSLDPGYLF